VFENKSGFRRSLRMCSVCVPRTENAVATCAGVESRAWKESKMDASRVLGTLRAHCDRLELELRELDADIEEAKAMVRGREISVKCRAERRAQGKVAVAGHAAA